MNYLRMSILVPVDKVMTGGRIIKETEQYMSYGQILTKHNYVVKDIDIKVDGLDYEIIDFDKDEAETIHINRYGDEI